MAKAANGAVEKVLKFIKDKGIKFVDLKFMDFPGQWQHFTVPVTHFDAGSFEEGFGFDGSSATTRMASGHTPRQHSSVSHLDPY